MAKAKAKAKKSHHLDRHTDQLRCVPAASGAPNDLLTTEELADWLDVSEQFVELSRHDGSGPKFIKLGKRMVRYRRAVLAWLLERGEFASTAEHRAKAEAEAEAEVVEVP